MPTIKEKIRLNEEVKEIRWSQNDSFVTLLTSNGEMFTANHLIITTSLGYLKANHSILFSPTLPLDKVDAIEKQWMGKVEKYKIYYEHPFWTMNSRDENKRTYAFLIDDDGEIELVNEITQILGKEVSSNVI